MMFSWEKRWSFSNSYYCKNFVIRKIESPSDGWHVEELHANGETKKHYGTYRTFESAKYVAEAELKRRV